MAGSTLSPILETAIGVVLVWFVVASLCAGIVELIGSVFGFRAKHLWRGLKRALGDDAKGEGVALAEAARLTRKVTTPTAGVIEDFVEHLPGVTADSLKRVPYVGAPAAALALVAARRAGPSTFDATQLGALVRGLPVTVTNDVDKLREWFERWFDSEMESLRISYRKNVRWWAALVALFVVGGLALDSVGLATRLYRQPTERTLLQAQAEHLFGTDVAGAQAPDPPCQEGSFETRLECVRMAAADIDVLHVSVWQLPEKRRWTWPVIGGMLVTFAAMAAGAPFWFDVLRRLMGSKPAPAKAS